MMDLPPRPPYVGRGTRSIEGGVRSGCSGVIGLVVGGFPLFAEEAPHGVARGDLRSRGRDAEEM
jgi:hypothetical protein